MNTILQEAALGLNSLVFRSIFSTGAMSLIGSLSQRFYSNNGDSNNNSDDRIIPLHGHLIVKRVEPVLSYRQDLL